MTRAPFPVREVPENLEVLEIIHSDVCGPMRNTSPGGSKYFVTFTDEKTRYSRVYFLKNKNEVLENFKIYKNEVENFTGKKIKFFQTDNGKGEYCNRVFDQFLQENGIQRRLSAPYTPQQNGLAERMNRTLLEKARCMMTDANVPPSLWAEAVHTANYLRNRTPSRSLNHE
ncbi:unnamed protein product [Nesidiocoris tenuis]|uniref:Integrase catalytic domain-containing protein n=1 Tax=Nesidiocoris tenuis TaxID=355587 RepID=A0A6H5GKJ0_9HEMI|nr:unnamed protein product [Nesidiocoris tenuis]